MKLLYWSILVYEFEEASVSAAELKADRDDQLLEVHLLISSKVPENLTRCDHNIARSKFNNEWSHDAS